MRADTGTEQGSALIWALLFVIVTSGMIISHTAYMAANRKEMDVRYRLNALADTFARSGLTDALGWFQRQANQPVTAFSPEYQPAGDPPLLDTMDPTTGLVREFEVRGSLWARYEIRKGEVRDISAQRGEVQAGSVWDVGARGYVFRLLDPDKPFDVAPNRVVAVTNVRTEMRGIPMLPPAPAALAVDNPNLVWIRANATVQGGGRPAIVFPAGATAAAGGAGALAGTPPAVGIVNYDASPQKVFSMRLDQLKTMADYVVRRGQKLPKKLSRNKLIFIEGSTVLTSDQEMKGRGLIIVNGNFATLPGSEAQIRGMLYVNGNVSIIGEFRLRGSLVARGSVSLGGGTDKVAITYVGSDVKDLKKGLARYRLGRSFRPFFRDH